ncbi:MAG: sugar ABC transporter permease [Nitrososphaeria archaeon]
MPAIAILMAVGLAPFVYAVALSFYKWPPYPTLPVTWNGIANYLAMLSDSEFWNALTVILKFMVVALPIEFLLGMIVALVFADFRPRIRNAISSFVLIPTMLAPIAVGATWFLMFTGVGPIIYIFSLLGLPYIGWLSDPNYALLTIIIADIWEWTPFVAIVFLSGLLALPVEPFESAKVDGASEWQIFKDITLPLLRPIVFVVLLLRTTDAIKMFDIPFVLTQGGPGDLTESISLYIYHVGLYYFNPSYAACLTMAVMVMVTIIITLYMRFIYREGSSFGGEEK